MMLKHPNLGSLWNEWHGTGQFEQDTYGGVAGRDSSYGPKWRKHINGTLYSRTSRLVQAIQADASDRLVPPEEVIAEWDPMFTESRYSVHTMVKKLQAQGKIPKLGARGKAAGAISTTRQHTGM